MFKKFWLCAAVLFAASALEARVCFLPQLLKDPSCGVDSGVDPNDPCWDYTIEDPATLWGSNYDHCYNCIQCTIDESITQNHNKYKCDGSPMLMHGNFWKLDEHNECVLTRVETCPASEYTYASLEEVRTEHGANYANCYNCTQCPDSSSDNRGRYKCTQRSTPINNYIITVGKCVLPPSLTDPCIGYDIDNPAAEYGPFYNKCYDCRECTEEGNVNVGKYKCINRSPTLDAYLLDSNNQCVPDNSCSEGRFCVAGLVGKNPLCTYTMGDEIYTKYERCLTPKHCDGSSADTMSENGGKCWFNTWYGRQSYSTQENYAKIGQCAYSGNTSIVYQQYTKLSHNKINTDCYGNPNPIYEKVACKRPSTGCYRTDADGYACQTAPSDGCTATTWQRYYWCQEGAGTCQACVFFEYDTLFKNGLKITAVWPEEFTNACERDVKTATVTNSSHGANFVYQHTDYGYIINEECVDDGVMKCNDEEYDDAHIYRIKSCYTEAEDNPAYNVQTDSLMQDCGRGYVVPDYVTPVRYTYDASGTTKTGEVTGVGNGIACGNTEYFDECRCQEAPETQECLDYLASMQDDFCHHPKVVDGIEYKACCYQIYHEQYSSSVWAEATLDRQCPYKRCEGPEPFTGSWVTNYGYPNRYAGYWKTDQCEGGLGCDGQKTAWQRKLDGELIACPSGKVGSNCTYCHNSRYCETCENDPCFQQGGTRQWPGYGYKYDSVMMDDGYYCYLNITAKTCEDWPEYPLTTCPSNCTCYSVKAGTGYCYKTKSCNQPGDEGGDYIECNAPKAEGTCPEGTTWHRHSPDVADGYCEAQASEDPNCACQAPSGVNMGWCYQLIALKQREA